MAKFSDPETEELIERHRKAMDAGIAAAHDAEEAAKKSVLDKRERFDRLGADVIGPAFENYRALVESKGYDANTEAHTGPADPVYRLSVGHDGRNDRLTCMYSTGTVSMTAEGRVMPGVRCDVLEVDEAWITTQIREFLKAIFVP